MEAAHPNLLSAHSQVSVTSLFSIPTFPSLYWTFACAHTTGPLSSPYRKPDTIFTNLPLFYISTSSSGLAPQEPSLDHLASLRASLPLAPHPGSHQVLLRFCFLSVSSTVLSFPFSLQPCHSWGPLCLSSGNLK